MGLAGPWGERPKATHVGVERLPKACISPVKKHPLFGPGWRVGGSEICPQDEDSGSYQRKGLEAGVGPTDLTLPLVEMAEMERPVMEVTVTEQDDDPGQDWGVGVIASKLNQNISRMRNLSQPTDSLPWDLSYFPSLSLSVLI